MDKGAQFPYDITHKKINGGYDVRATHRKTGTPVGLLSAFTDGKIAMISVDPEHRRKGVATAMWNYAKQHPQLSDPYHSKVKTDDGEAWAQSLGDK
jgi:ribosomal protein S18 acetylase RimI-like enzyme